MTEARDRRLQHFSSSIFSPGECRATTPPPSFSRCPSRPEVCEKRDIPTYKSTVFTPADPVVPRHNPYRPPDHCTSDFYRMEQGQGKRKGVELKHCDSIKPKEKHPAVLHRSVTPPRNPTACTPQSSRKAPTTNSVLRDTKNVRHERGAGIDENTYRNSLKWTDARSEIVKKDQRERTPEERRLKESQSSIFGDGKRSRKHDENLRGPAKLTEKSCEFDPFGREKVKTVGGNSAVRELTPTSANWKDARYEDKKRKWGDCYSPAEFRDMQLRSSFDPPCTLSAPAVRKEAPPAVPYNPPNAKEMKLLNLNQLAIPDLPKPEEVQLDTFLIKGLKPTDDAQTVKQLCQGLHIVSVETAVDDIAGSCTGQAKVVLRHLPGSDTVDRLKLSVTDAGLEITPHQPDIRRKSNYRDLACTSFLDHQLQMEEKRFPADSPLPPKLTKMKLLGSTADLFGSTPGLGASEQNDKQSMRHAEQQATRETLQRWQTVKKTRSQTPTAVHVVRMNSSFLRPTESWTHKTKQ